MRVHGMGSVSLLLFRRFPDRSPLIVNFRDTVGWKPVKMPDPTVLDQLHDDLVIRVEVLDLWSESQRMDDALETLKEFGNAASLSAIDRFETELRSRVQEIASLLAKSLNVENIRWKVELLLQAAAEAKAAIQARSRKGH